MRKSWWTLLCVVFIFGTVTLSAETYKECTGKCEKKDDRCNTCCATKENMARNDCGTAAVKAIKKCRTAAKTDEENVACDAAFEANLARCADGSLDISKVKFLCGVPTPTKKKN